MTQSHLHNPKSTRQPPTSFFALGYGELPERVQCAGKTYRHVKTFKHDFFAATGLYQQIPAGQPPQELPAPNLNTGEGLAVLKLQRTFPLFGLPMQWLGAMVARHEIAIFQKLQGIDGIPEFIGCIGPTGYMHAFVPGADLAPEFEPDATFFARLHELLAAIHNRHVAYVDTNKRENILFGADGRPHLIDFQISFNCSKNEKSFWLKRRVLARLQVEDWYHFYKHKTRLCPQACTPEDFANARRRSWYIRVHRFFAQPIIHTRRKFLRRYAPRPGIEPNPPGPPQANS